MNEKLELANISVELSKWIDVSVNIVVMEPNT